LPHHWHSLNRELPGTRRAALAPKRGFTEPVVVASSSESP